MKTSLISQSQQNHHNIDMNKQKTLKETVVLGVFFLLLVTTYASFSHIVTFIAQNSTQVYSFQGEVALIINYIVYLGGLSRASSLTNYKRQFLIAAICYAANYILYLFNFSHMPALIVSILGAVIGGFGASILWVSQGGYMMKLFSVNNIGKDHEGYYLGIQNGLIYGSSVLGAIIIAFGLGFFGNQVYFVILTVVALLGFALCFFFLDPLSQGEQSAQVAVAQTQSCAKLIESTKKVGKFFFIMKYLFAAMVLDGLMLGFTTSYFNHLIPLPIRSPQNVGIVFIINGIGAIIGGYLSGSLSDKIMPSQLGIMGFLFLIISFLLTSLSDFIEVSTLAYPIFLSFLWGVGLYFLQGWIFVCCAKVYQGRIETFAVVKQVHTISFIVFQIYLIIVGNQINYMGYLIVLIGLSILSIYSCKLMQHKYLSGQKQHEKIVQEISPQ